MCSRCYRRIRGICIDAEEVGRSDKTDTKHLDIANLDAIREVVWCENRYHRRLRGIDRCRWCRSPEKYDMVEKLNDTAPSI